MAGEKTEKATPKKRKDARREGQVFKSAELVNVFSLVAILILFRLFSESSGTSLMTYMQASLDIADTGRMPSAAVFAETFVWVAAPFLAICLMVGVAANYAQVGLLLVGKNAMPKLERINPAEGARRIFSRKTLFTGVKTVVKLAVIALLGWRSVRSAMDQVPLLTELPLAGSLRIALDLVVGVGVRLAFALAVIGAADYVFERLEHENRLKMTKQEVKDEYKKTEGDPVIKSSIRSRQMRMARLRMMHSVPGADVVIVNPTHYAVAVRYEMGAGGAPVVVAKGTDRIALKIREIAEKNGVHITENRELARALFARVDIGQAIPPEHYRAVAEILAYVYRMKRSVGGGNEGGPAS